MNGSELLFPMKISSFYVIQRCWWEQEVMQIIQASSYVSLCTPICQAYLLNYN